MSTAPRYHCEKVLRTELHNGDSLSQPEFHKLYEKMPEGFRAELIDGVVYVREPLGQPHSDHNGDLIALFVTYRASTPGVQSGHDLTVILGKKDEVQPDLMLRILPKHKGQSTNSYSGLYVQGAPELLGEVAFSSRALDLHQKKQRYQQAGVIEYMVVCLQPKQLYWFDLRRQCPIEVDSDGVFRSKIFPGLWIHQSSILACDYKSALEVLQQGLESDEHEEFVERLAASQK